jgi:hypothetical protein
MALKPPNQEPQFNLPFVSFAADSEWIQKAGQANGWHELERGQILKLTHFDD